MTGVWNRILRIDATHGKYSIEALPDLVWRDFIGGLGLGTYLLARDVPSGVAPFDPANEIIFSTGPFQGTGMPGSGKWTAVSRSPLTGSIGFANAGAEWGTQLKQAGYDALVITGKAASPVWVLIDEDRVEIRDASHLWGLDAIDTTNALYREVGQKYPGKSRISVVAIGPAGEKKVAIACLVADTHSFAGRGGLGAVLGSKYVKAVVATGNKSVPVASEERLAVIRRRVTETVVANARSSLTVHGTPVLVVSQEAIGDLPVRYWNGDVWPEGAKKLGAPEYTKRLAAKPWPCHSCPIGCHRRIETPVESRYRVSGAGPEYESLGLLGSNCLVDDLDAVAKANEICNRLGIDTISAGSYVGFVMEAFERGLIGSEDLGGRKAIWGDGDFLIDLLQQIGERKGFGEVFAGGIRSAAANIGRNAQSMTAEVRGMDLPAHDPRTFFSLAITYATSPRGACHLHGFPHVGESGLTIPEAGLREVPERFSFRGKAKLAAVFQDYASVFDSLVQCIYMPINGETLTDAAAALSAVTDWDIDAAGLMKSGERIFNLQRLVNILDGKGPEEDKLPPKILEPGKSGFRAGRSPVGYEEALAEYYAIRGWDSLGRPTEKTKVHLNLANLGGK